MTITKPIDYYSFTYVLTFKNVRVLDYSESATLKVSFVDLSTGEEVYVQEVSVTNGGNVDVYFTQNQNLQKAIETTQSYYVYIETDNAMLWDGNDSEVRIRKSLLTTTASYTNNNTALDSELDKFDLLNNLL